MVLSSASSWLCSRSSMPCTPSALSAAARRGGGAGGGAQRGTRSTSCTSLYSWPCAARGRPVVRRPIPYTLPYTLPNAQRYNRSGATSVR